MFIKFNLGKLKFNKIFYKFRNFSKITRVYFLYLLYIRILISNDYK